MSKSYFTDEERDYVIDVDNIKYEEFTSYIVFKDGTKMLSHLFLFEKKDGLYIHEAQEFLRNELIQDGKLNDDYEYKITALYQDMFRSNLGGFSTQYKDLEILDPREVYKTVFKVIPKVFQLIVYLRKNKNEKAGGNSVDNGNKCLFRCINEAIKNQKYFKYDNQLKKFLGVESEDKVNYKLLPKLEDKIKANIYLIGNYTYTSNKTYAKSIHLKLDKGHYTLVAHNSKQLLKSVSHKQKEVIFYFKNQKDGVISTYDGKELKTHELTPDIINKIKDCIIKHKEKTLRYIGITKNQDLKEEYNNFVKDADEILNATNGKINLYKNPNYQGEALRIFYNCSKCVNPEVMTTIESLWHKKCFKGGLRFTKPGLYNNTTGYDINKQYTSILTHPNFKIPIKQGIFKTLDKLNNEYLNYGIYRVKITNTNNTNNILFKFNIDNYYTHFDIKRALKLDNLKIELIQDGEANALLYTGNKTISGAVMFKPYFDFINEFYNAKTKQALKKLMNILWGSLMMKNTTKLDSKSKFASADGNIQSIIPLKKCLLLTYEDIDKPYKFDYARLGAFLTSNARASISRIIEPYQDQVIYLHTDGFMLTGEHNKPELGDEMGQLKQDKYYEKCKITHLCEEL